MAINEDKYQELDAQLAKNPDGVLMSRRTFLQSVCASATLDIVDKGKLFNSSGASFTIISHSHQTGLGWYFRDGYLNGKHYRNAYSMFYSIQKAIDALRAFPWLTVCLEFDSHAYEATQAEDAGFVQDSFRPLVSSGRIDIVGGTYSQPYASLVGWQSNIRQFTEGRAILREVLGKRPDCFVAEEISFHPQMPQLLKLCGYGYACLDLQNNGSLPIVKKAVVNWQGLNGDTIPTIPHNPWVISLAKQYQSLAGYSDQDAISQDALLIIWAEIWPPGLDWGASFAPYAEGFQSLRAKGVEPKGLSGYMKSRCKPNEDLELKNFRIDDAEFMFGWPQNKGILWEKIGGWGYEGDALLKENRRLEHELNATEMLLSLHPDHERSERLRALWKKLMMTQNHDCFIVSGYPGEYEHVLTTDLQITGMMTREVDSGARQLRQEALAQMATGEADQSQSVVICQNPAGVAVRQPIELELPANSNSEYALESNGERIDLQRIKPAYENADPRFLGIVDLPSCGYRSFSLARRNAESSAPSPHAGQVANEIYSIRWDEPRKGFVIFDRQEGREILFRPFSGEITRVTETLWHAPNAGDLFRAQDFRDVSFESRVETAGPSCHALVVRGNILTLSTTKEPAAWVTARARLYRGLRKVDIATELHTYPSMKFLALAEMELEMEQVTVVRDFPFGEEESRKEQCSALNYVRLESPGFAMVLAHSGTQQFFCERASNHVVLKNMIAREVLKGTYRWHWSFTTGSSFTPAESYRFAEASWGQVVTIRHEQHEPSHSLISVDDPALVVFRFSADAKRMSVWLMNYSNGRKQGELTVAEPLRNCTRVDFEGNPMTADSTVLDVWGKRVRLTLAPWEIAALELDRG